MYSQSCTKLKYLLCAAVIACLFSASVTMPVDTQGGHAIDDYNSKCSISNLFAVQDIESGVNVSFKNSLPDSSQRTVTLPDQHLPSVCGPQFSHCNMILINDPTMSTQQSVLAFSVMGGVALILHDMINGTLQFVSYHILELSSAQIGDSGCEITTLIDFSDSAAVRNPPSAIGLCLNEVNIRKVNILIDFNNLSRSSLSRSIYDIPISLHSAPRNLSNFVSITNNLPLCWDGLLNSLIYYFEQSNFGLFDAIGQDNELDTYTLYYDDGEIFVCSLPRQLVRVSQQNLIMYCDNVTAEIDMCEFSGSSVRNVRFYNESSDGVPYYCSPDMSTYVTVSGKTITFNSTINRTLPLMLNKSVYFGNCIQNGDNVLFAFTTTIDNFYVLDLQQEDGVLLKVESRTILAQHQVYNESILYTNGSSTMLYNTSCRNEPHRIIIDHPYHLALHTLGEGLQSCSCPRQVADPTTTTEPGPGNELSETLIIIVFFVIVAVATVATMIMVSALIRFYKYCKRAKNHERLYEPPKTTATANNQDNSEKETEATTSFTDPSSPQGVEEDGGERETKEAVDENAEGEGGGEGSQDNSEKETEATSSFIGPTSQQEVEGDGGERGISKAGGEDTERGGEGEGEGGQETAGEASTEDVSTQTNSSPSQSETTSIDHNLAQSGEGNGTLDEDEHVQANSANCLQEYAGKNANDTSVVLTFSHQTSYNGITISQSGATVTNDTTDENLPDPCDDVANTRTDSFNFSLGNCGSHPDPTTDPVQCST